MSVKAAIQAEATRLHAALLARGAVPIEADLLLPAESLLDLYGEDIRARAYVTHDALRGEMMLRPDFTVPVVQAHMRAGAEPARYAYAGPVFRQQYHPQSDDHGGNRPNEYLQVGYEVFDRHDPLAADAEVFGAMAHLVAPVCSRIIIGDIGLLRAAIEALETNARRKAALCRHLWRPRRFRVLLEGLSGGRMPSAERTALLAQVVAGEDPLEGLVQSGMRAPGEVRARLEALRLDAQSPQISREDVVWLEAVFAVVGRCHEALAQLEALAHGRPVFALAVSRARQRIERLEGVGISIDHLIFEASYGRAHMEYYDGFVFGFYAQEGVLAAGAPPIASGGRYDALTAVLGQGRAIPAVGGIIRPGLLYQAQGARATDQPPQALAPVITTDSALRDASPEGGNQFDQNEKLKIGVPSKGRLMEKTFEWFGQHDIVMRPSGSEREYAGAIEGLEGAELVFLSASEIPRELAAGRIHLGVTGSDLVREKIPSWPGQLLELMLMGFGHADLVVAVPEGWADVDTLDDLDAAAAQFRQIHGHRLRIATKYHHLTRVFLAEYGLADYHLVDSQGATEGCVKHLIVEAVADITSSGETLRANHLKILSDGLIHASQATLFLSHNAAWPASTRAALARLCTKMNVQPPL